MIRRKTKMNDSSKKHKENQIEAKSRIDSSTQILEPIDFSFKDIMNFNVDLFI